MPTFDNSYSPFLSEGMSLSRVKYRTGKRDIFWASDLQAECKPYRNSLSGSQKPWHTIEDYSTRSTHTLCNSKAKILIFVWTGLAHRNRKSTTSFSYSHAQVPVCFVLPWSPSPATQAGHPRRAWSHVVRCGKLWHVILCYVQGTTPVFPCYKYQFSVASCFSYSTLRQKQLPGTLIPGYF